MVTGTLSGAAREWLLSIVPSLAASLDRLSQLPDRMRTIFSYDPGITLARDEISREMSERDSRRVVGALADDLQTSPRLNDRETFRAAVARVKAQTGVKGRALLHPIRVVLTGEPEGPELDLIVPAVDRATRLSPADGLQSVTGARERASAFESRLQAGSTRVS